MSVEMSFADLSELLNRLDQCVTIQRPLRFSVLEVYEIIKFLESLEYIKVIDKTELWTQLFRELVKPVNTKEISTQTVEEVISIDPITQQVSELVLTSTTSDYEVVATSKEEDQLSLMEPSADGVVESDHEKSNVSSSSDDNDVVVIEVKPGTKAVKYEAGEPSADVVVESDHEKSNVSSSSDDNDVVVVEVEPGTKAVKNEAGKNEDSWASLYCEEESSNDDTFEMFIMEIKSAAKSTPKQRRSPSLTEPSDVCSTTHSVDRITIDSSNISTNSHVEEDVEKSLFKEITNSVHSRRRLSRRKSVTRVMITEDCIEAEEFLDDEAESSCFISDSPNEYLDEEAKEDESSQISDGTDVARKLFSDESEISSINQPVSREKPKQVTDFYTPSTIMDSLKASYSNVNFKKFREKMAQDLFMFYNVSVFDSKLPSNFEITWNIHLTKTAGLCYYSEVNNERRARVELSTKVCTDFERLRDVLIHELCHAATWVFDGMKCGHGAEWKRWTQKVCQAVPGLPVITTCHNYEIPTKHVYHCTKCDYSIGRHSKSINLITQHCPLCTSHLKLQPKLKADGTPRQQTMSPFAQFVKENYSSVRKDTPQHGQVMSKLALMYKQTSTL
ncbi:germ cell nuclear acidic protein-like isoform X2 [Dysidea avara]|uniref:germ cell nuclear acidic protein-like isoform X2 n=1 Tax=Dysidea avara TaxID=196820 RepID=UPI003317314C